MLRGERPELLSVPQFVRYDFYRQKWVIFKIYWHLMMNGRLVLLEFSWPSWLKYLTQLEFMVDIALVHGGGLPQPTCHFLLGHHLEGGRIRGFAEEKRCGFSWFLITWFVFDQPVTDWEANMINCYQKLAYIASLAIPQMFGVSMSCRSNSLTTGISRTMPIQIRQSIFVGSLRPDGTNSIWSTDPSLGFTV
jgi:hypothetical protein